MDYSITPITNISFVCEFCGESFLKKEETIRKNIGVWRVYIYIYYYVSPCRARD
jgi:hypothetical protein